MLAPIGYKEMNSLFCPERDKAQQGCHDLTCRKPRGLSAIWTVTPPRAGQAQGLTFSQTSRSVLPKLVQHRVLGLQVPNALTNVLVPV